MFPVIELTKQQHYLPECWHCVRQRKCGCGPIYVPWLRFRPGDYLSRGTIWQYSCRIIWDPGNSLLQYILLPVFFFQSTTVNEILSKGKYLFGDKRIVRFHVPSTSTYSQTSVKDRKHNCWLRDKSSEVHPTNG